MGDGSKRLRVLISAYGCQPGKGSEFGVGWNQVEQSARFNDVWVITRAAHRQAIENELKSRPNIGAQWVYFDLPGCTRLWKHAFLVRLYYYIWQLAAYFLARRLNQQVEFNVAHHVTFVTYSFPSFLALLPIPHIWGPVGGGESAPEEFRKRLPRTGRVLEILRGLARALGELDPLVRITAKRSALGLGTTHETEARLMRIGCGNTAVMPAVALPTAEIEMLGKIPVPDFDHPFRIFTVGRLLYWKGHDLALRAFARFHEKVPASEYWIIGEGRDRRRLERLCRELRLTTSVTFLGRMSRTQVFERVAQCHVMLFPSLHDSGGWVCLEAMAARRPVVCLDLGGPALQVTSDVGIKIPAVSPKLAVADLAEALEELAGNPQRRLRLGECARARVERDFNWNKKGAEFAALYASVARTGSAPAAWPEPMPVSPSASVTIQ